MSNYTFFITKSFIHDFSWEDMNTIGAILFWCIGVTMCIILDILMLPITVLFSIQIKGEK
jgi:hypothetical protein